MTVSRILAGLGLALASLSVAAASADDLMPMDISVVEPGMLNTMFGPWVITDESGSRACKVVLKNEPTIGGLVIEVDPGCAKTFPVMADITAWRLMQDWAIDLVDGERKLRIRFTTPDDAYVAEPETDGIFTILQPQQE